MSGLLAAAVLEVQDRCKLAVRKVQERLSMLMWRPCMEETRDKYSHQRKRNGLC